MCAVLAAQGLRGLWYGLVVGYVVTTIISGLAVYFTDWASVLEEVQDRNSDATVLTVPLLSATENAGLSLPRRSSQCDLDMDLTGSREQDT
jgi:hypothetical protein